MTSREGCWWWISRRPRLLYVGVGRDLCSRFCSFRLYLVARTVFFFFFLSLSLFPREPNSPQLSPSSCDLGWAQRTALDVELSARSLHPPIDDWLGPRVELVGHLATRHIDTRCAMPSLFFTAIDELAHQSAMIVRAIHTLLMAV